MLITKVHALAQGYSGVQWETLQRICWHIDEDVIPSCRKKAPWALRAIWRRLLTCSCH
jgi:histidine ammonia-lyase